MTSQVTADPLTGLAMWADWQDKVRAALPNYAASPWYVEQDSLTAEEVNEVAEMLRDPIDPAGKTRDVAHGARAFPTQIGDVTRAWVDGNIEIDFLYRNLPPPAWRSLKVLDIGAGYGRLAVMLSPVVREYVCVDAVPVSTEVCRAYTQRYEPDVRVFDIPTLRLAIEDRAIRPTLAINIHSWNECSGAQILEWLTVLEALEVPWLFTVSHGQNPDAYPSGRLPGGGPVETSYRTWGAGVPSFRPLLLERYDLVAEESIGISRNPHALWRRRDA